MSNFNTNIFEIKREILVFSNKLTKGLSKPRSKFVTDFLFGLNAAKSTLISNIARELKEDIDLGYTIERLCNNIHGIKMEELEIIMSNYYKMIQKYLDDEVYLYIDDSDITKPYGKKFEDLDYVVDGSAKAISNKPKTELGYYVASAVVLSKETKQPIPLYNNIYSLSSKGIKSKTDETYKSIQKSLKALAGKKVLLIGDRGYDNSNLFRFCLEQGIDFNIRLKNNRTLWFKDKRIKASDIAQARKGKIKMELFFQEENKETYVSYTRVGLDKKGKDYTLVIVYGLSEKEPLILLTSKQLKDKEEVKKVVRSYFNRWRIEEYFRFIKEEDEYENIRIRTLKGMNVVSHFVLLRSGHVSMIADAMDRNLLFHKIIEASKSLRKTIYFWSYQVSNGIKNILSYSKTGIRHHHKIETRVRFKQLSLKLE